MQPHERQQQQANSSPTSAHEKMRQDREFVMEFLEFVDFMQEEATFWRQPAPPSFTPSTNSPPSSTTRAQHFFPATPSSSVPGAPSFSSSPSSSSPTTSPPPRHHSFRQRRGSGSTRPQRQGRREDERAFSLPSLHSLPSYQSADCSSSTSTSSSSSPLFTATSFPCAPCSMLARKTPSPPPQPQRPTFNLSADLPFYSASLDDNNLRVEERTLHEYERLRGGGSSEKEARPNQLEEAEQQEVEWGVQAMEWMRMNPPHQPSPPQHHEQLQRLADGIIEGPHIPQPQPLHYFAQNGEEGGPAMEVAEGERQEDSSVRQKLRRS